jgi:hypothetical protein
MKKNSFWDMMEEDESDFLKNEQQDQEPAFMQNLNLFKHYGELIEHFVVRFGSVFINFVSGSYEKPDINDKNQQDHG